MCYLIPRCEHCSEVSNTVSQNSAVIKVKELAWLHFRLMAHLMSQKPQSKGDIAHGDQGSPWGHTPDNGWVDQKHSLVLQDVEPVESTHC